MEEPSDVEGSERWVSCQLHHRAEQRRDFTEAAANSLVLWMKALAISPDPVTMQVKGGGMWIGSNVFQPIRLSL